MGIRKSVRILLSDVVVTESLVQNAKVWASGKVCGYSSISGGEEVTRTRTHSEDSAFTGCGRDVEFRSVVRRVSLSFGSFGIDRLLTT